MVQLRLLPILVLTAAAAANPPELPKELSLSQALNIALANSTEIRIEMARLQQAMGKTEQFRSAGIGGRVPGRQMVAWRRPPTYVGSIGGVARQTPGEWIDFATVLETAVPRLKTLSGARQGTCRGRLWPSP
jgi:hypothetical protein